LRKANSSPAHVRNAVRALINILVEKGVVTVEELSEQLRLSANEELVIIEAELTEQYDAKFKFDSDQENA